MITAVTKIGLERLLIAALCLISGFVMFVPPEIGIANNGDFGKLIGRFSLGPSDPTNPDEGLFYEQRWRFHPTYAWMADNYSTEVLVIGLAVSAAQAFDNKYFDIRWVGTIHAALWIGCFASALPLFRRLSGWRRYTVPLFLLFVVGDVSYLVQFNSFHTDTAACIFLAWCVVIALRRAIGDWTSWRSLAAFLAFSVLFIGAKPQHALLGIPLYCFLLYTAAALPQIRHKVLGIALASALPLTAILTIQSVPDGERRLELFNEVFANLTVGSTTPADDLRQLGLPDDYARFQGWEAGSPNSPYLDPAVRAALTPEVHQKAALFCVRHPWRTLRIIYRGLQGPAVGRRPVFLGNYQRESGLGPRTLARSFHLFSSLRSLLFRVAPWHMVLWYTGFVAGVLLCVWRAPDPAARRVAVVGLLLAVQGLLALAFATLGESGETDRHLWIFHVITDFTIVMAVSAGLGRLGLFGVD